MNGRVFKLDIPTHQAVQELLPWYATARLNDEDNARVEAHLQSCAQCQQDLQWERDTRAALIASADAADAADAAEANAAAAATAAHGATSAQAFDAERALARLLPQLGEQQAASTPHAPASRRAAAKPLPWWRLAAANQASWLRWAAVAQCAVIIGLLVLLARPDAPPAEYRAMGAADTNPGASSANLVIVFRPDASEQILRAVLQAQDARIVDGPTVTGAWLLAVPPAERDQALQALRANPAVRLAESIDKGGAQ